MSELRRAAHLVLYWQNGQLVLHNYACGRSIPADPFIIQVLEQFPDWRPVSEYLETIAFETRDVVGRLLEILQRDRWLWRRGEPLETSERGLSAWKNWNPAAGFFHSATRNPEIVSLEEYLPTLRRQAAAWPMPSPVAERPDHASIALPRGARRSGFERVLRLRRTWRQFGQRGITLDSLAQLLHLTAGVQHWVVAEGEGRVPLKTSPSGGARHPIELYVVARKVRSLAPGVYHYASSRHALQRLSNGSPPAFDEFLPTQWWYRDAAALVLLTSVFERTQWRYKSPRAYRAVLIEAGHVCQTFCLAATWLGLAPFCSMAIAESFAEDQLGIDGFTESVVYAAGVGARASLKGGRLPGMLPRRRRRD